MWVLVAGLSLGDIAFYVLRGCLGAVTFEGIPIYSAGYDKSECALMEIGIFISLTVYSLTHLVSVTLILLWTCRGQIYSLYFCRLNSWPHS